MDQDISARLEDLRATISDARAMPMSASAVINRSEVLALIDDLRHAIDAALVDARAVVGHRDAVLAEGASEAERIVRDAEIQQEAMLGDTAIYTLAQQRIDERETAVRRETESLRQETETYVEQRLAEFESTLVQTLEAVRRGRERFGYLDGGGDHRGAGRGEH